MSANLTAFAYLIAAVLFILALRGLSSPVTSRQGNRFGMIGMGVAVVATLAHHGMGGVHIRRRGHFRPVDIRGRIVDQDVQPPGVFG